MSSKKFDSLMSLVNSGVLSPVNVHQQTQYVKKPNERGYFENIPLEDVSSLSCNDFEYLKDFDGKIFPNLCFEVRYCSGSDYSGSSVELSNYQALTGKPADSEDQGEFGRFNFCKTYSGMFGTFGVLIHAVSFLQDPETDEDTLDCISGLDDYLLIDEGLLSEIEFEASQEAYEDYYAKDFIDLISKKFPSLGIDFSECDSDRVFKLFRYCQEKTNTEFYYESIGSGSCINLNRLTEKISQEEAYFLVYDERDELSEPFPLEAVTFSIEYLPEEDPIEGNILASGEEEVDKRAEDEIREMLSQGIKTAFCQIHIQGEAYGLIADDYLGHCSYFSEQEFEGSEALNIPPDPYCIDMKNEVLNSLNESREKVLEFLEEMKNNRY